MEQIQLNDLLEFFSPEWISLLSVEERDVPIVLQDGLGNLEKKDLLEIVEAVIMQQGERTVQN
ncbi:hypothetical protein ACFPU1_08490 [Thalassorhabdus alkalitolerans]|uniref:Uncharacterized protein n=1 Tax=Thalassorhabdus alkalitolerans TaxID=2282697 RepID=A0ABW0YK53_9BACI|nr:MULTISPECIES: hypothetical protein [Bacillaceae]